MRTRTTVDTLYSYDELSDKAKDKALQWMSEGALDHDWWDSTYDDAKNLGLEIEEFDTYRNTIDGKLTKSPAEVCALIVANHGKSCDTYKLAMSFFKDRHDGKEVDLEEFKHDLLEEYLSMLSKEADYLTSREALEESIRINEYEFTENGEVA